MNLHLMMLWRANVIWTLYHFSCVLNFALKADLPLQEASCPCCSAEARERRGRREINVAESQRA